MPLIPPALDDRSYNDLVQDMLASIPAHTPEWTIQQTGDPGRTLIELFAWLGDSILYRANLIPERQRIAFLKLLGTALQPAAAATTILSIFSDPASTAAVTLASAASVPGPPKFETLTELDVLPVTAQAYIKAPLTSDQKTNAMPLLLGLQSLYSMPNTPSGYATTPVFANNAADPNGVDVYGGTIDQCIWFALLAGKPANQTTIRNELGGKHGQRILSLGFAPSIAPSDPFADAGPQAPVPVTWQISANSSPGGPLIYHTMTVADDGTSGLTTAGVVQLLIPQVSDIGAPPNDVRTDALAGVGPKPPRVDDPDFDSLLVAWIRVNVQAPFTLTWAGINAVEIDQRTTYNNVIAGVSDGSADQQFALAQQQIDPSTFQLDVDMPGLGFQLWTAVDDLGAVQGPVPAYRLDAEAGTVTFGNQMQGMIPPMSRRVRARVMRAGGGAAGNVSAGSLTSIQANDLSGNSVQGLTVQQPIDATGGADPETFAHAEQRIPSVLRHQNRAVTASDYQSLTLGMPGGGAARCEVLPLFKPQTRDTNVPGVVSVMVIPPKYDFQPPCPRAQRPLLDALYAYLDPRRPVAAEMYVIGSEYIGLGVSVAVEVRTGFNLLQVARQVEMALRTYLWPIAPGGPSGQGWPLGRTVRSLELDVIVSQVQGVVEVNGIELFQPQPNNVFTQILADANGNAELTLNSWQLPELLQVLVTPGPDGSGVEPGALTPVQQTDNTVAVPVAPSVC